MSDDKLRDFVLNNRSDFDVLPPPKDGWKAVEQSLHVKNRSKGFLIKLISISSIAAMFILFVGIGIGKSSQSGLTDSMVEFMEVENYLGNELQVKYNSLNALSPVDREVDADLQQLENVYEELKKELKYNNGVSTDLLISKMIENYNFRIFLLEKVLDKTTNNKKIDDEEFISI